MLPRRELMRALAAFLILCLPVTLMGLTFPLLLQRVARTATVGHLVGRLTAVNTIGAVLGSMATGYLILPALGAQKTLGAVALVLAIAGAATARSLSSRRWPLGLAAAALAAVLLAPAWNLARLTSGTNVYFDGAAKPDEIDLWRRYTKENGRSRDIVFFGDGGDRSFNFLDYEVKAQGLRGIGSVTECVMRILEAERIVTPGSSAGTDPFWERSPRQLLNNTLPVLYCAYGTVRMEDIYNFITSAPKSVDDLEDAGWQARSFMFKTIVAATDAPQAPIDPAEGQKILRFWQDEFAPLDAKTRGNVVINLSSALDRFLRGRLRDHFCRATNLTPEDTFKDGRIILMAMPSLSWNEDGLIGQHVFKYMWQRAVLRRNAMAKAFRTRPVFLWADEAQYFVGTKDAEFQATCRSSLACTLAVLALLPRLSRRPKRQGPCRPAARQFRHEGFPQQFGPGNERLGFAHDRAQAHRAQQFHDGHIKEPIQRPQ